MLEQCYSKSGPQASLQTVTALDNTEMESKQIFTTIWKSDDLIAIEYNVIIWPCILNDCFHFIIIFYKIISLRVDWKWKKKTKQNKTPEASPQIAWKVVY